MCTVEAQLPGLLACSNVLNWRGNDLLCSNVTDISCIEHLNTNLNVQLFGTAPIVKTPKTLDPTFPIMQLNIIL